MEEALKKDPKGGEGSLAKVVNNILRTVNFASKQTCVKIRYIEKGALELAAQMYRTTSMYIKFD